MQEYTSPYPAPQQRSKSMETAALILSAVSIISCTCLYVSFISGALAIILASLSRGGARTMSSRAMAAAIIGGIGIALSLTAFTVSYFTLVQRYGSIENALRSYSDAYGINYADFFP